MSSESASSAVDCASSPAPASTTKRNALINRTATRTFLCASRRICSVSVSCSQQASTGITYHRFRFSTKGFSAASRQRLPALEPRCARRVVLSPPDQGAGAETPAPTGFTDFRFYLFIVTVRGLLSPVLHRLHHIAALIHHLHHPHHSAHAFHAAAALFLLHHLLHPILHR